jgi:O-antigen ligase/tetratricopeptide (TPR) repeat protein
MTTRPLLPPEALIAARSRWDVVIEVLVALLLVFMPLAFGAVEAWSELVALGLAAALTLIIAARAVVDRTFTLPWTWAYVPFAAFVGLSVLQVTPLSQAVVSALSPASVATRAEFLEASTPDDSLISMYPLATSHMLRLVLLGGAFFFAALSAFPTPQHIKRLLLIVFAIGCAEGALALLQIFTGATKMYWLLDQGTSRLTSGSFINHSHFSQFMNLSIGAGLALLLVRLYEDARLENLSAGFVMPAARPPAATALSFDLGSHGALIAGLILSALAVLASLSRNGAITLVVAGLVVGTALFMRGALSSRGWVLAALPLGALAVLLMFGFDVVYERFATLRNADAVSSRWEMTLGTLRAWQAYPWVGSGLGTHEYVFPMFDAATSPSLAAHADNDYAQLLEETGVVGAAAVAAFLAIVASALVGLCRRGVAPISAAAYGLLFGLIAVAIHSASDFGQHIPAVFALSAIACGIALRLRRLEHTLAARDGNRQGGFELVSGRRPRIIAGVVVVALALGWTWILRDAYAAHIGEEWWNASLLVDEEIVEAVDSAIGQSRATDQDYADLLVATEQAAAAQPSNIEYAYTLNLRRWESLARAVDPATGAVAIPVTAKPIVERIASELAAARPLCPTYGPPYALEGQLRLLVLGEPAGRDLIRKGVRLAGYDPPTCLIAGELAARDGETEEAARLLNRAVALSPGFFQTSATIFLDDMNRPNLAIALAGDNAGWLGELAALAAQKPGREELVAQLRTRAEEALRARIAASQATAGELAQVAALDGSRGDNESAAELYFEALKLEYHQYEWRMARAAALIASGRPEQALREVRICLRQRPDNTRAQELLHELTKEVRE